MATRAPSSRGAVALDGPRVKPTPPIPVITDSGGNGNGSGQQSLVTSQRRYLAMMNRYSLAKLSAQTLIQEINNFHAGTLKAFALRIENLEQGDDVLMSVVPKREAAVKRMKWQVMINEDVPVEDKETAEGHRKALFHFYNNLTCTHAMDANRKGGFSTFVELAMKCVGYKWAAFETIWKPDTEGLTAEMSFVPLRFFENSISAKRLFQLRRSVTTERLGGILRTWSA
jgi:phage gp29-like protein